jgi:hypothetical protein
MEALRLKMGWVVEVGSGKGGKDQALGGRKRICAGGAGRWEVNEA